MIIVLSENNSKLIQSFIIWMKMSIIYGRKYKVITEHTIHHWYLRWIIIQKWKTFSWASKAKIRLDPNVRWCYTMQLLFLIYFGDFVAVIIFLVEIYLWREQKGRILYSERGCNTIYLEKGLIGFLAWLCVVYNYVHVYLKAT